jgi:hypothetical protein
MINSMEVPQKVKIELAYNLASPLLGIAKEPQVHRNSYTHKFIAALL